MGLYRITDKMSGLSIREFLDYYHVSKRNIYNLFFEKRILINGKFYTDKKLELDDVIQIIEQEHDIDKCYQKIDIVFENQDVVVVDKKAQMLVHSDGNTNETLLNCLENYYQGQNVDIKCIHRIDYETIGLVLFSKTLLASSFLNYQMENQLIEKKYQMIVHHPFVRRQGVIDAPIGKNRHQNNQYVVCNSGKKALTLYEVISQNDKLALVEANIKTGRTHQIRVHMKHIGHPIVSDKIYYQYEDQEMKLMSKKLSFIDPYTLKKITIEKKENFKI